MSTKHLSPAESAMAALAEVEDITQELLVTLSDAHTLVEQLALALAEWGIQPATHPDIFQLVDLLQARLGEHAVSADAKPTLDEIADRVGYQENLSEE